MIVWLIVLVLVLFYIYYRWSIRHLLIVDKMFPGPPTWPILGNALMFLRSSSELALLARDLAIMYRRSFRVWLANRVFVIIWDVQDLELILGSTTEITKSEVYDFLLPWIGYGLLTSTGDKWRKQRKILTPAFHFKILERFISVFNNNGDILCDRLSALGKDETFDVFQYVKLYALDNICETAMGVTINAQKNPKSAYVKAIKDICSVAFKRGMTPWLRSDLVFNLTKYGAMQKSALEIIHGTTNEVIRDRKLGIKVRRVQGKDEKTHSTDADEFYGKEKLAFLDILLKAADENGLTDEEIREQVDTFMFEGHDTITSAISWCCYNLAVHPKFQEIAYQEQMAIFGDDPRGPDMKDLNDMKYLEQVIKESLRLYPSVPMIARRVSHNVQLDEFTYIPKDAQLVVMLSFIHRDPRNWGNNSQEFDPEHFAPDVAQNRHPFAFVPFSAGSRNCIGQRFAMMEMKSALGKMLRRFELLPSPHPEDEPRLFPELILTSENGIKIRVQPRNTKSASKS